MLRVTAMGANSVSFRTALKALLKFFRTCSFSGTCWYESCLGTCRTPDGANAAPKSRRQASNSTIKVGRWSPAGAFMRRALVTREELMRTTVVALLLLAAVPAATAQNLEKLTSNDVEVRTGLTFKVSDAVVQRMLPAGWQLNSPAAGPTRGFNLGVTLIDQSMTQDPDGKPLPARSYVVLNAPAKKVGTDIAGTMVLGGFIPHDAVPGAYGVYGPAKVVVDRKQRTEADGKTAVEETWEARADDGSAIEIQIQFMRGALTRGKAEAKIYSAARPDFYRTYRLEQAVDVVRSAPTGVDRASKFSLKAIGPKLAPLFDGSEQLVSITSIPHYWRSIYVPSF
jgi:hypothetical protein